MKTNNILLTILIALLFVGKSFSAEIVTAGEEKFKINSSSKLWFDGTSTFHDFTCYAEKINGNVVVKGDLFSSEQKGSLQKVHLSIPVTKIINEDEDLTENMHESFNAEDYPTITYNLSKADLVDVDKNTVKAITKGKLKVAGVTKTVQIELIIKKSSNKLLVNGNTTIKMTDFGIERPTMFLGTIKTGDEIKIFFDLTLIKG